MKKAADKRPDTYAKAGVDFRREDRAVRGIQMWVRKTFAFREGRLGAVLEDVGSFANLIDLGEYALAFCTDGVGSKVLIAQELDKYDTVGIDCIAMNVNDAICLGAEPISAVDYLALQETDEELTRELSKGLYEGARLSGIAIVGGETASMPDVITGPNGRGFDIAAAVIGIVKKEKIITGKKIQPGNIVLGFRSSGVHSNGLSLARKVVPKSMWMNLLTPTRIYVKEVMELVRKYDIHGMANITGGGFLNLCRLTKHGFVLDSMPEPQMIFKKIQELGKVSDEEMHRTFNMGVGYCMVVSRADSEDILKKYGDTFDLVKIGYVVEEPGVTIVRKGVEIKLDRVMY
jgi:phosphoribosylformylglycinamidine cyclo-ligase